MLNSTKTFAALFLLACIASLISSAPADQEVTCNRAWQQLGPNRFRCHTRATLTSKDVKLNCVACGAVPKSVEGALGSRSTWDLHAYWEIPGDPYNVMIFPKGYAEESHGQGKPYKWADTDQGNGNIILFAKCHGCYHNPW